MQNELRATIRRMLVGIVMLANAFLTASASVRAKDYILTLGGGYEPAGNQASMEANVLFFQELIHHHHPSANEHHVYFSDGHDHQHDVQILATSVFPSSPALDLLRHVFFLDRPEYAYRDHQIRGVRGSLSPDVIREGLDAIAEQLTSQDRLLIYVTAHGSEGSNDRSRNTSITCWEREGLTMRTFARWMDRVPRDVPVIVIMAQCYCGGFSHFIFDGGDPEDGLAHGLRAGFFAQRYDLPAAGCRPDIENDEEYSSYFWGAFQGKSRTGRPIEQVDLDQDQRVSFAEAHASAVIASQTIDIPLKTSDALLRLYSRIAQYEDADPQGMLSRRADESDEALQLVAMTGTLEEIAERASREDQAIIRGLARQLRVSMKTTITDFFRRSDEQYARFRAARRTPGRRGPRSSGRRDLQREIVERWPELRDPKDWEKQDWLREQGGKQFLDEVKTLPHYEAYNKSREDRRQAEETAETAEIKDVLFRRLIHTLENVILAENLPKMADPSIVKRYRAMVELESSFFDAR